MNQAADEEATEVIKEVKENLKDFDEKERDADRWTAEVEARLHLGLMRQKAKAGFENISIPKGLPGFEIVAGG